MLTWIAGLMAENYEAVGFIPITTIAQRYIAKSQYIIQHDDTGKRVGYLLHGPLRYARPATVTQHCIQYEKRLSGHGKAAFLELLRRCEAAGCNAIRLRVAEDLAAVCFWRSLGFIATEVGPGGKYRGRMIVSMIFPLSLPLFT